MESGTEKTGFFERVKSGLVKFLSGVKNFFVKTGRVNGTHCYGCVEGIGDFLVYDDHALISAVGMDDVTFKNENVISYCFDGLGRIRRNKATVKYTITLDDTVIFSEKVREKNDVKNLTVTIFVEKDRAHFWGQGQVEYGQGTRGLHPLEECDIYGYQDCFVVAVKLERRNGDKVEKYQESVLYPFANIESIGEGAAKVFTVRFKDGKNLSFTAVNEAVYEKVKNIEIK